MSYYKFTKQNIPGGCFAPSLIRGKRCLIRYLHPGYNLSLRELHFKNKIIDIHKIEKKNCISISDFGYENRENYPIYLSKNAVKKHVDLFLIEEDRKRHYAFINDFNILM